MWEPTKDHIVSRGLFVQPYPANLPTVQVCLECNQRKSRNEDYFRDALIINIQTSDNATARALFDTTLTRSIHHERGNLSKVAHIAATQSWPVEMVSQNGVFMGYVYGFAISKENINAVLADMVKGLYFKMFRRLFPENGRIQIFGIKPDKVVETWYIFEQYGCLTYGLGDVFHLKCISSSEEPCRTAWLLLFYERVLFIVSTSPPE